MRTTVILSLVAAFALVACGSSHASASQPSHASASQLRVQQALDKTARAASFRAVFTSKFDLRGSDLDVTLRGDVEVDNRSHLVRIRFEPATPDDLEQVVISSKDAEYYDFSGQGGWLRLPHTGNDVSGSAQLSDLVDHPEYVVSHLRVQRVTALDAGHFRVWSTGLAQPLELWIASSGYITQMHMIEKPSRAATQIETVRLSDFGRSVHLATPAHLMTPPALDGTD